MNTHQKLIILLSTDLTIAKKGKISMVTFVLQTLIFIAFMNLANAASPKEEAIRALARGDYAAQLKIVTPLAKKGEAWAQTMIGKNYGDGNGVKQNYMEALKWFRLAAAQGDAAAQFILGPMYGNGQGVPQDYQEAMKWFPLAAAQGDLDAQFNMGVMYAKGLGVKPDLVKAHMWFNLAASKGVSDGIKSREIVAQQLTSEGLAAAQKLARECLARNFKGCD